MKHTYTITGMTCNGCRSSVEKALNSIEGIEAVVSLDPPIATLLMKDHIPLAQLQETLSKAGSTAFLWNLLQILSQKHQMNLQ
jgi:Cu2+-exporting ATPase